MTAQPLPFDAPTPAPPLRPRRPTLTDKLERFLSANVGR
jgi:hypothetical protein